MRSLFSRWLEAWRARRPSAWRQDCPFCGGKFMSYRDGLFYCFRCHAGGDLEDLW